MSSLREVAEAANGQGSTGPPDTVQESATAFAEFYRLDDPPTVLALLDVVEALVPFAKAFGGSFPQQPDSNVASPQSVTVGDYRRAYEALARLPEEARR